MEDSVTTRKCQETPRISLEVLESVSIYDPLSIDSDRSSRQLRDITKIHAPLDNGMSRYFVASQDIVDDR